jgi:excisionase family DNA binding protein
MTSDFEHEKGALGKPFGEDRQPSPNLEKRAKIKAPTRFSDNRISTDSDPAIELLTVAEAAEFLGISIPTIRRFQLRRFIPFVKIGRSVRFLKSDLVAYVARRRVESIE